MQNNDVRRSNCIIMMIVFRRTGSQNIFLALTTKTTPGSSRPTTVPNSQNLSGFPLFAPVSTGNFPYLRWQIYISHYMYSVDLCITSVAEFLPKDHDETAALGRMSTDCGTAAMNPVEQAQRDAHMARIVEEDAANRTVRWDEDAMTDLDADGEDDEQFKERDEPAPLLRRPTPNTVEELVCQLLIKVICY
jgi:hypothetical protein